MSTFYQRTIRTCCLPTIPLIVVRISKVQFGVVTVRRKCTFWLTSRNFNDFIAFYYKKLITKNLKKYIFLIIKLYSYNSTKMVIIGVVFLVGHLYFYCRHPLHLLVDVRVDRFTRTKCPLIRIIGHRQNTFRLLTQTLKSLNINQQTCILSCSNQEKTTRKPYRIVAK